MPRTPSSRLSLIGEFLAWLVGVAVFLQALRAALFDGRTTFIHDVLYWTYPVYHFLASSALQGRVPYWNPFSHAGEPLYPLLLQLRMLDPFTLLALAAGSLVTNDLTMLFNWSRVACGIAASFGAYLLLRQWTPYLLVRASLVPVLLWSSLVLTSFRQTGTNDMFLFAPYAGYFLFRLLEAGDGRWRTWIGLATTVGLAWQSYYFVGVWVFVLIVVAGFAMFHRDALGRLLCAPGFGPRAAAAGLVVALMALPNAVVMLESGRLVFPPRLIEYSYEGLEPLGGPIQYEPGPASRDERGIVMPYALVRYTGSAVTVWDLALLTAPHANRPAFASSRRTALFSRASEMFIYLGLLGYAAALLGLLAGRHPLKRVWVLILAGFGLLMLGSSGGLHQALYYLVPPLWFLRHTHLLLNFFLLASLYFYVLGANRLVEWRGGSLFGDSASPAVPVRRRARVATCALFVVAAYIIGIGAMAAVAYSSVHWPATGVAILLAVGLAWTLRGRLGRPGVFWGIVLAHTLVVMSFAAARTELLWRMLAFLGAPLAVLLVAAYLPPRGRRLVPALLTLALVADLGQYLHASSVFWSEPRPDRVGLVPTTPAATRFPDTRVVALHRAAPYGQALRYLELATQTPAAFSSVFLDSSPWALTEQPPLDTVLNSRRWNSLLMLRGYFDLIHAGIPPAALEELLAIGQPLIQFRPHPTVIPRERFAEVLRAPDVAATVRRLRSVVILDKPPPESSRGASTPSGSAGFNFEVIGYGPDALELAVEAVTAGFVVYADGYDPHWKAWVDGQRVPVLRANGNAKAVQVGAGRHVVRFAYDPVPFRLSLYAFFATPAVAAIACGAAAIRGRRQARSLSVPAYGARSNSVGAP